MKDLAMWEDDVILFAGYTEGDWNGPHTGDEDFAAGKLNADGSLEWRWQVTVLRPTFLSCPQIVSLV